MGRIKKYCKEVCPFRSSLGKRWRQINPLNYYKKKSKEVGSPITITKFVRFERGEGIEKKRRKLR